MGVHLVADDGEATLESLTDGVNVCVRDMENFDAGLVPDRIGIVGQASLLANSWFGVVATIGAGKDVDSAAILSVR